MPRATGGTSTSRHYFAVHSNVNLSYVNRKFIRRYVARDLAKEIFQGCVGQNNGGAIAGEEIGTSLSPSPAKIFRRLYKRPKMSGTPLWEAYFKYSKVVLEEKAYVFRRYYFWMSSRRYISHFERSNASVRLTHSYFDTHRCTPQSGITSGRIRARLCT